MDLRGLEHIAIAVPSLREALTLYQDALGFILEGVEEVPAEGMRAAMIHKNGLHLEIMESTDPEGPVGRFLAKRGGGVHHVSFSVADLDGAIRECRQRGLQFIEPAPRPGVHGTRVAFLHPKSTGGVLIELQEAATKASKAK